MTELQKLEQQVAELQATIERMKEQEPIKQWHPQGGMYWISASNAIRCNNSTDSTRLNGTEYQTKQQAEWASKQMRKFNRLLAYVAEHDVDENGVQWMPIGNRYYVVFDGEKWIHDWHHSKVISSIVYMSKQCAVDLVGKLNSGSVIL